MFFPRDLVEEEVTGDAVLGCRCARDNRDVVGVGERGHGAICNGRESGVDHLGHVGDDAVGNALRKIFGVKAVNANCYCGS